MSLLEAELPPGRRWAKVGDFFEVTRKPRGLDISGFASVPFARMDAIPQGGDFEPAYIMKAPAAITSGTYFEKSDILVAKITPSFENGKQALTLGLPAPFGYATTEIIPLRPRRGGHDRRLLFYFLLHPDVRAYVAEKMEGTTGRQRVPEGALLELPFPEFKSDEESSIADTLHAVQLAIKAEDRTLENNKELKRAAMRDLFTRGLRGEAQKNSEIGLVPKGWEVVPLGSLGRVGNGSTPKKTIPEYWIGGTYPWLTSAKVYDREIEAADEFVTERALRECHLPRVEPGAILIAITGQGKTLGHCAVLGMQATINQHIAYVATDTRRADPSFVRGYLETQYDYLRQVGSGGGSTKGALTCAFLRSMPIPFPLLDEQREIVEILDTIDRKIDLHNRKRVVLEDLFKALLHRLVTGELRVADLDLSALGQNPISGVAA